MLGLPAFRGERIVRRRKNVQTRGRIASRYSASHLFGKRFLHAGVLQEAFAWESGAFGRCHRQERVRVRADSVTRDECYMSYSKI